jgi:hypothetical protein
MAGGKAKPTENVLYRITFRTSGAPARHASLTLDRDFERGAAAVLDRLNARDVPAARRLLETLAAHQGFSFGEYALLATLEAEYATAIGDRAAAIA